MKVHYLLIIVCLLVACKSKPAKVNADSSKVKKVKVLPASYKVANTVSPTKADTSDIAEQLDAYADYYVVVADTGLNYYGDRVLDPLIDLAIKNNWQIFDTGSGEMINLTAPSKKRVRMFTAYLKQILKK